MREDVAAAHRAIVDAVLAANATIAEAEAAFDTWSAGEAPQVERTLAIIGDIATQGVFDLAKTPADSLAAGAIAKVDATGTVGAAGTKPIGWVILAAGAGTATVRVKLVPGITGAVTMASAQETQEATPHHKKSA